MKICRKVRVMHRACAVTCLKDALNVRACILPSRYRVSLMVHEGVHLWRCSWNSEKGCNGLPET